MTDYRCCQERISDIHESIMSKVDELNTKEKTELLTKQEMDHRKWLIFLDEEITGTFDLIV
jgi:hypothetical protein